MPDPLVYVGKYKIPAGKLEIFKQREKEIAEFVEANESQITGYMTYLNEVGTEATGIQIHPNSESMLAHLEVIGPKVAEMMQMIEDVRIELYGTPSEPLRELMTQMAQMSGVSLMFHEPHAGFTRF